jgi:glutathione synthase/RimK-type ligase-like ATP-grasp enzyme
MTRKIAVITGKDEVNVDAVLSKIDSKKYFRINTDEMQEYEIALNFDEGKWSARRGGESLLSRDIEVIWYRRPDFSRKDIWGNAEYRAFAERESRACIHALCAFGLQRRVRWMNHPDRAAGLERNKVRQMEIASEVGFSVPATLLTNDPSQALKFLEAYPKAIMKSFGPTQVNSDKGPLGIFTNIVTREDIDSYSSDFPLAPVMLQRYIEKQFELRITIVGEKVFACRIDSQASERTMIDWRRYDFDRVEHSAFSMPVEMESALRRMMLTLGLNFGAVDMIVTPDNKYVFLEVNPSGQWGWIEARAGLPISDEIASFLQAGS